MKRYRLLSLPLAVLLLAGCDHDPAPTGFQLPGSGKVSQETTLYICHPTDKSSTTSVSATYLNNDDNSIALITLPGEKSPTLMVNVVSGSGARYVGGAYEWWTSHLGAKLTNAMDSNGSLHCIQAKQN